MTDKIYPDHDPHCVIYQLGEEEHCNCSEDLDDEFEGADDFSCDICSGTGMRFEGDVHVGDCQFCCGGTL